MSDKELDKKIQQALDEHSELYVATKTARQKATEGQELTEEELELLSSYARKWDDAWALLEQKYPESKYTSPPSVNE